MPAPDPVPLAPTMAVRPWSDPVIDQLGHDLRSDYVERFWLGILGPSTTFLLRRIAAGFDTEPDGFDLDLHDTARSLGLGVRGGSGSPFLRAITRSCQFGLARRVDDGLEVRRRVPPLTRPQVERLPERLRDEHQRWQEALLATPTVEQRRRRARHLALSLLELGEDEQSAESQLHHWRYHPAMAHEAVVWARHRHEQARLAAEGDSAA
ncbi:MAG TPA: hypothetical protein VK866_06185 [Acidimicrobiales bacterium]|nr:hypothetical protein [Acidimicrobiales bacterium]